MMLDSWEFEEGQLQVHVEGHVMRLAAVVGNEAVAARLAAVMIPLPGRLLSISCSSFRMPKLSSVVGVVKSRLSSKRSKDMGELGSDVVVVVGSKKVGCGVGGVLVVDSRILDMYFMYQSSMLWMLDVGDEGVVEVGSSGGGVDWSVAGKVELFVLKYNFST